MAIENSDDRQEKEEASLEEMESLQPLQAAEEALPQPQPADLPQSEFPQIVFPEDKSPAQPETVKLPPNPASAFPSSSLPPSQPASRAQQPPVQPPVSPIRRMPKPGFQERMSRRLAGLPPIVPPRAAIQNPPAAIEEPNQPAGEEFQPKAGDPYNRLLNQPLVPPLARQQPQPQQQPFDFRGLAGPGGNMETKADRIIQLLEQILEKLPGPATFG